MCECGCGEGMAPTFTFAGPAGITYAVALYDGCRDCGTPAVVMLYEIPDSQREPHMLDDYPPPPAPWVQVYGWREVAISLSTERHAVARAFAEFRKALRASSPSGEGETPQ